jgi:DNA-binding response OmpR family regulator
MIREALIVEDDPDVRRLLAACLRRMGFHIHEVKSGGEAVRWLEVLTPDLVLLDLRLPDVSGLRVCERIRASKRLRDVPVLVISALTAPSDFHSAEAVGVDDYLVKPFHAAELTESVRELVGRSEITPS